MDMQIPPIIGDILFLMHRKVEVRRVYTVFRFVAVRYLEETTEFYVDVSALSKEPNCTNQITLSLVGENYGE